MSHVLRFPQAGKEPIYVEIPLQPYLIRCYCPNCDKGEMSLTKEMEEDEKTMYEHTCNHCSYTITIDDIYPRLVYEEVD